MLHEELENGVKSAFLARLPGGLADHEHVLRGAFEKAPVADGDEYAPMVVIRFFDEAKKGSRLWRVPFEVSVSWNVDATANSAAEAMVKGVVARFAEQRGGVLLGWVAECNAWLPNLSVIRWWVTDVKHSDPQDRGRMQVISGHVWVGEK